MAPLYLQGVGTMTSHLDHNLEVPTPYEKQVRIKDIKIILAHF